MRPFDGRDRQSLARPLLLEKKDSEARTLQPECCQQFLENFSSRQFSPNHNKKRFNQPGIVNSHSTARMAKLADAPDLGSGTARCVWVQVPLRVFFFLEPRVLRTTAT